LYPCSLVFYQTVSNEHGKLDVGLLVLKRKGQTKGKKYVADRRKMYGRGTRGTARLWAVTDFFSTL